MATPEERLEAMLADFRARNGTDNPNASQHLREAIDGDADLKKNVLKAITDGDLNRFALQPAAVAPAVAPARGSYGVEERTIYLPAATLNAAVSTDRDAVTEVKTALREQVRDAQRSPEDRLDRLLDRYQRSMESDTSVVSEVNRARTQYYDSSNTPAAQRQLLTDDASTRRQLAADIRTNVNQAINSSPTMKADLLREVEAGRIATIQDMPEGRSAAGAYGPFTKAFHINAVSALAAQPKGSTGYYELVGAIGHEVDHSQGAVAGRATLDKYKTDADAMLRSPGPEHNFTEVVRERLNATRNSEARGQIDYLNSIVDAMPANKRTAQNLAENVPIDRRPDFFDETPGSPRSTYALKPAFTVDPPGSLKIPQTKENVEAMATSFFDRPQFGANNATSYRNMVAAGMVNELLTIEARNGTAEMRVDLKSLALDHRQIQPLLEAATPPRTYFDMSDGTKVRLDSNNPTPIPPPAIAPTPGAPSPSGLAPGTAPTPEAASPAGPAAAPSPAAPTPAAPSPTGPAVAPAIAAPSPPGAPAAPVTAADGMAPPPAPALSTSVAAFALPRAQGSSGSDTSLDGREQAQPQRQAPLMLDSPAHENHGMFAALLRTVNERDTQMGRTPDELSRQVAGGLTQEARDRGLTTIGAAQFTPDGTKVGMTDTADLSAPWAKTAVGDVGQLASQTLAKSSENVAAINQQQTLEQSLKPPMQTQTQQGPDDPSPKGPRLV